ncbi:MAG: putative transcriptional regulator [Thermoleophilaceae bacterium]|nr:putative transcriptional regulator [Thermoleophilaceae bacterium]
MKADNGPIDTLAGQLLIAAPSLLDPNFQRSVVAIAEHSEEGALGLVLNRPTETLVAEAVPELELPDCDERLFIGGPVRPDAAILVAQVDPEAEAIAVADGIGVVRGDLDPAELERLAGRARVFAGHAGWGPGQLEGEVEREDWILAPARGEDLLGDEPEGLWVTALLRLGGEFALLARMPLDPSLN